MIIREALAHVFLAHNNQYRLQTNGTAPFGLLGAQSPLLVGPETWSRSWTAGGLARYQLYPLPSLAADVPTRIESVDECIAEVVMGRGGGRQKHRDSTRRPPRRPGPKNETGL